MQLDSMYQELILDHYKRPRNRRTLAAPTGTASRTNPTCGDVVAVTLEERDGAIVAVAFEGHGCSISQSSASMMTEAVTSQSADTARAWVKTVRAMITGRGDADETPIGFVPRKSSINVDGLSVTDADLSELLTVNIDEWRAEVPSIREHFATFGDRLPAALHAQVDALEQRLQ